VNERQPEREEARPVALANAPLQAVADQCQTVKTRKRNYRCVLTWFASRWRNHQPKRAEKPHSKVNAARRWPALLRGRRLRLPWRIASGSWQPPRGERLMSARERELGELPSPICPCLTARLGRDFLFPLHAWSGGSAERRSFLENRMRRSAESRYANHDRHNRDCAEKILARLRLLQPNSLCHQYQLKE